MKYQLTTSYVRLFNGQHYIHGLYDTDESGYPFYRFFYYRDNAVRYRDEKEQQGEKWKPINKYKWVSITNSFNTKEFTGEGYPIFL